MKPLQSGVLALAIVAAGVRAEADSLDTWSGRGGQWSLDAVTFGNGVFVATGASGTFTSPDGINWTNSTSAIYHHLAFGNGEFVAVGFTGAIGTSDDGTNWIARQIGTLQNFQGIAFGNGVFVTIGDGNFLWSSPNGVDWTRVTVSTNISALAFGSGKFLGIGGQLLTSADGVNWAARGPAPFPVPRALVFGNNLFLALGDSGSIYTSSDGLIWASQGWGLSDSFFGGASGSGFFVICTQGGKIYTSIDGANWIGRTVPAGITLRGIAYGHNDFLAVGQGGFGIIESGFVPDGTNPQPLLDIGLFPGLTITGQAGRSYRIDYTTDIRQMTGWQPLVTILLPSSPFSWSDFQSAGHPKRFYRAVLVQ